MLAPLYVPVPARRDVEVPLHFVPLQTAKHPTRIRDMASGNTWRLRKLLGSAPDLSQHMSDMGILQLELLPLRPILVHQLRLEALRVRPVAPAGRVAAQRVAGEDAVARGVLHVDV